MIRTILTTLVFAVLAHPAIAQLDGLGLGGGTSSTATMVAEAKSFAPGKPVSFALKLEHPAGWHSYYRNSGGLELPPDIQWTLPTGFTAGPIQWPVPKIKDGEFGKSFIYEPGVTLLVDITAPADASPGDTADIVAKATWQICATSCLPEDGEFKLTLPVAATSEPDPAQAALFQAARAKLPQTAIPWALTATSAGPAADIVLRLRPNDGAAASGGQPEDFVPNEPFLQPISAGGKIEADGAGWVITLQRRLKDPLGTDIPQGDTLSGILKTKAGGTAYALPPTTISGADAAAAPQGLEAAASETPVGFSKFAWILWGMFLGGLILNLMPCVFPVIGLKIMGFVQQAGEDRKKIAEHGLTFTLGVLVSFLGLSGIILAAREAARKAGGEALNWGFQLENPWVVLVLMLLMFVLALNMFGVFEIGVSATSVGGKLQAKSGFAGSFFSGVLATVVATPCSAPFLGAAIGAAIALPTLAFFTAFGVMGLGLATPYLVLSLFPGLIAKLPRPGPWMESFKQGMSFLLFGTAGYLLWVFVGQIDLENMLSPVLGLTAIAIAAWVYGRWCPLHRKPSTRRAGAVVAVVCAVGGLWLTLPPAPKELKWEPWSQARQDSLVAAGKPVFVDYTALWCLTCQVNKKNAYTSEVAQLMNRKGV
nr:thioredoxin family protein [Akkermansiaceae bacterium]